MGNLFMQGKMYYRRPVLHSMIRIQNQAACYEGSAASNVSGQKIVAMALESLALTAAQIHMTGIVG